jgi:spore maturation protein CgeB
MRIVIFCHSLLSDWNHGNAHFLRGVVTELLAPGHDVAVYEPQDAWSLTNLIAEHGEAPLSRFCKSYPAAAKTIVRYHLDSLDLDDTLDGADLVLVHEWNDHDLVRRIGAHRARGGKYKLLFHDTHHRAITSPEQMAAYDLSYYDGVLAFGKVLRDLYLQRRWTRHAWTWHEAADTRVFHPIDNVPQEGDLIWVGNWGDNERTAELHEFLIDPVAELSERQGRARLLPSRSCKGGVPAREGEAPAEPPSDALNIDGSRAALPPVLGSAGALPSHAGASPSRANGNHRPNFIARVHGVRYPDDAKAALAAAGIEYAGWLPNFEAPRAFARYKFTVHVPRRPYVKALPGIPTIRVFEALACGIPLICAPWDDVENLFTPGRDYLVAQNGNEMREHMRTLSQDPEARRALAEHGLQTVRARHTCAHRVRELLDIYQQLGGRGSRRSAACGFANRTTLDPRRRKRQESESGAKRKQEVRT